MVQRLVEDDTWTQDLADSINKRKEDQSHLAEEKIPEVLDLTKTDPTFTDFHALLTTGSLIILYLCITAELSISWILLIQAFDPRNPYF